MNTIVYVLDALRADHVSSYGYDRATTPTLDELADEGIRYTQCFSPATWTKPVGASLLTGAYPPLHGARAREDVFDADITRLPETLSESGIYTAGFSTMGNVSASLGYARGFDEFHDLYKDPEIVARRRTKQADTEALDHESANEIALPRAEDLSDAVIEWLEDAREEPFFLFCWSIEPHIPYDPPAGYRDFVSAEYDGPVDGERASLPDVDTEADLDHLRGLYDGEIRYNDAQLGRIIAELRDTGIYDDTTIIVLGDHGDAFNEHGRLTHGHLPYDELIHVPLIIKPAMSSVATPRVIRELASLVDVAPTLLSHLGIEDVPTTVEGRSLPPFGPPGSSAPVFSETRFRDAYPAFYSVRTEGWKYMELEQPDRDIRSLFETVRQLHGRGLLGDILRHPLHYLHRYLHDDTQYLYDLDADPDERRNLADEQPERVAELETLLSTWRREGEERHARLSRSGEVSIDPSTSEQLKQLGYRK